MKRKWRRPCSQETYDVYNCLDLMPYILIYMGFPGSSAGKESACNAGDPGSIPGSVRSPGEGRGYPIQYSWAFLVSQMVKNSPAMQETWVRDPGSIPGFDPWVGKIPWRRAWQPTPVFLLGESPWTTEPGRLQSMGSQRVGYNWAQHSILIYI